MIHFEHLKNDASENDIETKRAQSYFDLMYRIMNFAFAALTAFIALTGALFNIEKNTDQLKILAFSYFIPVSMSVFGIMFAYNAYALAVCGRRAEKIHFLLHLNEEYPIFENDIKKWVVADRKINLLSYGVPLGFFIVVPLASHIVWCRILKTACCSFWEYWFPYICIGIYYIILILIIISIIKSFRVRDIQNNQNGGSSK